MRKWLLAGLMALMAQPAFADGHVMISDAWVREAPPGATALAGYMVVMNHGDKAVTLVGAESPTFGSVMLHRTVMEGGMAKMKHQHEIAIPANGSLVFEPSSYHLMLMKPRHDIKAGDIILITIHFAGGKAMEVEYHVKGAEMDHGGMDHSHMHHH